MFKSCTNLESIAIGDEVSELEPECLMGSGIRFIVIPPAVKRIRIDAFRDCDKLEEIIFSQDGRLEVISSRAFSGTKIKEFIAPDSLTSLGQGVFAECH